MSRSRSDNQHKGENDMRNRKMRLYPPIIVSVAVMLLTMALAANAIITEGTREATEPQVADWETSYPALFTAAPAASTAPTGASDPPEEEPEPTYQSIIQSRDWDGEDSEKLMKIAMAEAEGESIEGKALVMLVVLNRVWSDGFPDSIEAVIFQRNQFSPVREGGRYWTTEPNDECREALELVMDGWDESQGALYFEAADNEQGWHSRSLEFLFQYGGHKFYR